jgi:YcaO-like protein with predicted kinase domain
MRPVTVPFFDRSLRAPKRFVEGSHRTRSPAATVRRARRLMKPLGITRLADLTGLDHVGVPVFSAIRPNGKSLSTSQGKGLDADGARASALMESIETWHAENPVLAVTRGSYRQLRGRAVDPRRLPRPRGRIGLDDDWAWVTGWDLGAARERLVPLEAVSLDTTFPAGPPRLDVSSNGLASGNHLLEAMVQGLCEVIERDAEARWRAEKGDRRIDLGSVSSAGGRWLLARLAAAGMTVAAWDLTSDVGVPVCAATLVEDPDEPQWRSLGVYQGFGCHLDPEIALVRAVLEAVQTRVTYIAGSRDDFFPFDYERASDPDMVAAVWAHVHRPVRRAVDLAKAPRRATPSFEGDVAVLVAALAAAGAGEVVVVDLTRSEWRLPVVKVLIPGRATDVANMG